jgi:hypothetical protein
LYTIVFSNVTNNDQYQLSVNIKSLSSGQHDFFYKSSIIKAVYKLRDDVIYHTELGTGVKKITFSPNEIKIFNDTFDEYLISDFLKNHPQSNTGKRKNLLFGSNKIPVSILITINIEQPVTLIIEPNIAVK